MNIKVLKVAKIDNKLVYKQLFRKLNAYIKKVATKILGAKCDEFE